MRVPPDGLYVLTVCFRVFEVLYPFLNMMTVYAMRSRGPGDTMLSCYLNNVQPIHAVGYRTVSVWSIGIQTSIFHGGAPSYPVWSAPTGCHRAALQTLKML